jgi:Sulfotransferase family
VTTEPQAHPSIHTGSEDASTMMPNFLMIGAQKSGTTAIYAYIAQHPQVFTSEIKEPGFFAFEGQPPDFAGPEDAKGERYRVRDLARYQSLFRETRGKSRYGEASNVYLYVPEAPSRIRSHIPDAKLIAILRDPVDRAISAYRHLVRDGREPLATFEAALAAEPERIAAHWHPHWHYRQRGFYHAQLARYYDLFRRDQIAVYTYDDFRAEPRRVLSSIFRFLEIDADFQPDMAVRHNVSGLPKSRLLHRLLAGPSATKDFLKRLVPAGPRQRIRAAIMERNIVAREPTVALATQRALRNDYRDDILKLETLLSRDLSMWRTEDQA